MPSVNLVVFAGHVGRDAELRRVGDSAVISFSLAASEKWTDHSGEKRERTEWARVEYWGKGAEGVCQYVTKGRAVLVKGSLRTDEWTDKEGRKRQTTKIRADQVQLLGGGRENVDGKNEHQDDDDPVPF